MAWSLFGSKAVDSLSVSKAVELLCNMPSAENRTLFYNSLKTGRLYIVASDVPKEWTQVQVLEKATPITLLTSSSPDGGTALLAFTSLEEVLRRIPSTSAIAMDSLAVLRLVLLSGFSGLIVNPAGPWAGVPAEDVQSILRSLAVSKN